MSKSRLFIALAATLFCTSGFAQKRIYVSVLAGYHAPIEYAGSVWGSNYAPGLSGGLELTFENRIVGTLYSLVGIGALQLNATESEQSSYASSVNQTFLTAPLLIRFNSANLNSDYFDFGVVPTYIVSTKLTETYFPTTTPKEVSANVAKDISRLGFSFRLGYTHAFGVLTLGWQLNLPMVKSSVKNLAKTWAAAGSSSFISDSGQTYGALIGVTLGVRVK